MRMTARDRFRRSVRAVTSWCRRHRHEPVPAQRLALSRMINGHYAYYGIAFNARALGRFLYCATLAWWAALRRRSQRGMPWAQMDALLRKLPLPQPRIVRPLKWLRSAKP